MSDRLEILREIRKGSLKQSDEYGDMSFFSVDNKVPAYETNRYKSGYLLPDFRTLSFIDNESKKEITSIIENLQYESAALLFSETMTKRGILPHIHVPFRQNPTLTFAKIFFRGQSAPLFSFYEAVTPNGSVNVPRDQLKNKQSFPCEHDTLFIFDSAITPHEVEVTAQDSSIIGFFFFENVINAQDAARKFPFPVINLSRKDKFPKDGKP